MDYIKVTIKQARDNFSDLIEKVALVNKSFLVTKFGKPKALITPVDTLQIEEKRETKNAVLKVTAGIWAKRKDLKDSKKWVNDLRDKESKRYGKIFS